MLMLLANGANIVRDAVVRQPARLLREHARRQHHEPQEVPLGLSASHDISRPGEMREIAFLEMPGFGINRLWWTGRPLRLRLRAFRRLHRSHPLHRRSEGRSRKPEIVSRWWLPGMHRAGGETPTLRRRASASRCIT